MTKIKLHFSQKTMTKTKSYFAVKMNTAAWAYCTGDDRLQDVERPAGTQPPTPALATSQSRSASLVIYKSLHGQLANPPPHSPPPTAHLCGGENGAIFITLSQCNIPKNAEKRGGW